MRTIAAAADLEYAFGREDALYRHLVPGECAGLVGTDHRHRTQRLDRGKAADDGIAPRHALHADGQHDGHDGRQAFRYRGDRQADGGKEHFRPVVTTHPDAERKGKGGQQQDDDGQLFAEARHLPQQRRLQRVHRRDHAADAADLGACPGGGHYSARLSVHDQRAGVGHASAVADHGLRFYRGDVLFHGIGLAGQNSFVDAQLARLDQAHVGRYLVAGSQQHDVADDQLFRRDFAAPVVAQHRCA